MVHTKSCTHYNTPTVYMHPVCMYVPTECGVSKSDHESSTMRRPWPTKVVVPW